MPVEVEDIRQRNRLTSV